MRPTKNGIILRVDPLQKDKALLGNVEILIGVKYKTNHRDKSPVIGVVEVGNNNVPRGTILVVHHNFLYGENSAYSMGDGRFSMPVNKNIFMRIDENGEPHSMFGNIICKRIEEYSPFLRPGAHIQLYHDRGIVVSNGYGYKKGQLVFTLPYSTYEIIYTFDKIQHRVIKIYKDDIVAKIPNNRLDSI